MENRHFNLIVVGDNPDILVSKYDSNIKVSPYPVYFYSDASSYRDKKIHLYEKMLENPDLDGKGREYIQEELAAIKDMDAMEFYLELTEGYTLDEQTGDAMSCKNPIGKYDTCHIAKNFAVPFILKNGSESYSAKKKDIDWDKVHLANRKPYEVAWDTVMENKKPQDSEEEQIYQNMKERKYYFSLFGDRESYIKSNTAFWGFAYLSKNGWEELDGTIPQFEWVNNFYDKYIKPLSDDVLISIYECTRN